jgi:hypothetical protein
MITPVIHHNIMKHMLPNIQMDEAVLKRAKSLFIKRNRILHHWLNPGTSKYKLNDKMSAAWDALPEHEKRFYISQVTLQNVVNVVLYIFLVPDMKALSV